MTIHQAAFTQNYAERGHLSQDLSRLVDIKAIAHMTWVQRDIQIMPRLFYRLCEVIHRNSHAASDDEQNKDTLSLYVVKAIQGTVHRRTGHLPYTATTGTHPLHPSDITAKYLLPSPLAAHLSRSCFVTSRLDKNTFDIAQRSPAEIVKAEDIDPDPD